MSSKQYTSKNFCYAPWTNLDISPQGNISPCCKFQMAKYDQKFNIQTDALSNYVGSAFLEEVKQEFLQGTWPSGCERCQIEEQNNIESKRQLDYQRWTSQYDQYNLSSNQFITGSVAFGNTCNLKCITCSPRSSSRWQQEYREIYNIDIDNVHFYRNDFVNKFIEQAPNIVHLDIPGGEPFLSGVLEQQQLLKHYVDSGQAKNITLHYTTNATVFPDQYWWELWQHFKEIDLQLSIDGVGARYEYIRYPGNWNTLELNVSQYLARQSENFRLSVSHTVSAYNIYYLDEFVSWCYNQGLPRPWMGRVHNPPHMRPTVWHGNAKEKIINYLSTSSNREVQNWARLVEQNDDSDMFEEFRLRLHQHDQYRNTNFASTFPELASYI
jgi:MoaA/NifB/PqqE/SkfB family radical SAM enzyme